MSTCVDIDIVVTYVTIRRHTKICLCFQCALSTCSTARHVTRLAAFIQPRPAVSLKVFAKGGLVENSFQFARELIRFHGGTVLPPCILHSRPPQTVTEPPRFLSHPQTSRVKNKIIKSRCRSLKLALRSGSAPAVAVFVFGSQISPSGIPQMWRSFATNFHPLSWRMHFATSVYLTVPSF